MIFCTAATISALSASQIGAQQAPSRGERGPQRAGGQPSDAMLQACTAKKAEESCVVNNADGSNQTGFCHAPEGKPLACVPAQGDNRGGGPEGQSMGQGQGRGPDQGQGPGAGAGPQGRGPGGGGGAGGPPMGENNSGTPIPSTKAYTIGVLCNYEVNKKNDQIGLTSIAKWNCDRGQRLLTANAVPDHEIGAFPNPANPNKISQQNVHFVVTTSPIAYSGPGGRVKEPVMGLNGVKFDPGTGGSCSDDITNPEQCPLGPGGGGRWNIEALGQDIFDFGEDMNNAHVQPTGAYHYHGVPNGMLSQKAKAGEEMALIGWAADGFPVYARFGYPGANMMLGTLKMMRTSYQLKQNPDTGRPSTAIIPMGAFMQDWEYVEGLGDLDQCNGRFGVTPEFPQGIYHYYATDAYPYIQRCVKGSIDSQPEVRRQGGGQGEGQGKGKRGGERGGRGGGGGGRGGGGGPGQ
ncbi:hypothetical protein LPB140_03650 [Sphingorhabdus lutea]|uniref:YHYH domain-containing protein n=1 Tax=Sphingorhabdus lutea TaxID=1913578 RepID=A0A1L3JA98_9SPHN|nr:YHYH protein [Sphingorhabdus lutea]APG62060.1 hypothetical protein LPB140_03650 [Sphingorhabdus lutea]